MLSIYPEKSFSLDIQYFYNKLRNNENFTFSKYADGEWSIIQNLDINNKEFWFDSKDPNDQTRRERLIESFVYKHDQYYVGISCPCCQGLDTFRHMLTMSNQPDDKITWANIWVNSNYPYYLSNIIPLYRKRNTVLCCNDKAIISNLPFKPKNVFYVKNNAWKYNWGLIEECKMYIQLNQIKDYVFLFCCGPFGNIICHKLTEFDNRNTYIDIGSTLNPFLLSSEFDRHYYSGDNMYSRLTCTWGKKQ